MDLCLACGLCCDGTLFSTVLVEAGEVALDAGPSAGEPGAERAGHASLPVLRETAPRKVPQPCPAFDGSCSVYADRPRSCRAFRCAPLAAVESGAMPPAEAAALLQRAKELAASVRARLPTKGALWPFVDGLIGSPEWRRAHAELALDLVVLRALLRRIHPVNDARD